MNANERLACKRALEALDTISAGLPAKALMDEVERMLHRPLATSERDRALYLLQSKEWVYTYRNSITDEVLYAATDAGRMAMVAL